MALYAMSR